MRSVACLFGATLLVAIGVAGVPAAVQASDPVAMVNGGGTADFVAHPNAVNTTGYTNFSVGATVYSDGTASGHFLCQVPAIVSISGDVMGGWVNVDGSVTVWGLAHGYDHFFQSTFWDMPFTVTFREGGPGVGGFDYRDESGFFGEPDSGLFDTELVRRGKIRITP